LPGWDLGLVGGGIWSMLKRRNQWNLRLIGGFGAAGMAVGVTVALLMPNEFISTAVLRSADTSKLQSTIQQVLSEENLTAIVRQFNLFSRELSGGGNVGEVVRKMRNERIKVQTVQTSTGITAFVISFRYPHRFVAQHVTSTGDGTVGQAAIGHGNPGPPSDPQRPSSPNRMQIMIFGTVAGVLLGAGGFAPPAPKLAAA